MALKFINSFELEPTNHCNAKCIFCPRDAITRPKGYLSWETFKAVVNKALELKIKEIVFAGFGEPFLHRDFLEFLSYTNKNAPEVNVNIISNASLITPKISDALNALYIKEMVISFNGYDKASYEKTMLNLSFDKVMTNLKYIAEHADKLRDNIRFIPVQTKVFKAPEYKKMKDLLMGIGFKKENFTGYYPCINRAGYLNNPEVNDTGREPLPYPSDEIMCIRFLNFLQIVWNGDIRLWYNDINDEAILGNINTSSNEEIQQKILYFRNPKTKPPICQRCNDPLLRGGLHRIK